MDGVIQTLVLDMIGSRVKTNLRAKQCDTNSRFILIDLVANAEPWQMPFDCTVYLYAKKPDGKIVFSLCDKQSRNSVLAPLTDQMLAVQGDVECELYIVAADGDIKSQIFILEVDEMLFDGNIIESADEFNALRETLTKLQKAITDARDATWAAMDSKESADIATELATKAAGSIQDAVDAADAAKVSAKEAKDAKDHVVLLADNFDGYGKLATNRKYANAIIGKATGTGSIPVTDAYPAPVLDLAIYGESKQDTTTGAQLCEVRAKTNKVNGVTITMSDDGWITVKGTTLENASSTSGSRIDQSTSDGKDNLKNYSGTYTLSIDGLSGSDTGGIYVAMVDYPAYTQFVNCPIKSGSITKEINATDALLYVAVPAAAGVTYDAKFRLMFNEGKTALPFEPYTGDIPSPNPDYPQSIKSVDVGEVVSSIAPENLLRYTNDPDTAMGKLGYVHQGTGAESPILKDDKGFAVYTLPANGYYNSVIFYFVGIEPSDIEGKEVTISFWAKSDGLASFKEGFQITAGVFNTLSNKRPRYKGLGSFKASPYAHNTFIDGKWCYITFSTTLPLVSEMLVDNDIIYDAYTIQVYVSSNNTEYPLQVKEIKVERGKNDNPTWTPAPEDITDSNREKYLPYISKAALPIKLRGIGNVQDKLSCRDGVWGIKRYFTEYKTDGTGLTRSDTGSIGKYRWAIKIPDGGNPESGNIKYGCLCSHFKEVTTGDTWGCKEGFSVTVATIEPGRVYFYKEEWATLTLAEVQAIIAASPITVVMPLATPIWEPLPDDQQAHLNNLLIYSGDTACVYVTGSEIAPEMAVEYVMDTNKVIQELRTAIIALGGMK